eukprot:jgi/Botrbrau1/2617/Bobra.145_1s0037.3
MSWSCPVDATWINPRQSLMCMNADEVLLMLKSSDRVASDLEHAHDSVGALSPDSLTVAVRKWYDLRPGREFRCFVRNHELVGVSQRDLSQCFPWLQDDEEDLLHGILEFFAQHIRNRFRPADYTFDVYVATTGKVKLVDFNPVGGTTSALLYTWDELGYKISSGADECESAHESGTAHPGTCRMEPQGKSPNGAAAHNEEDDACCTNGLPNPAVGNALSQKPDPEGCQVCQSFQGVSADGNPGRPPQRGGTDFADACTAMNGLAREGEAEGVDSEQAAETGKGEGYGPSEAFPLRNCGRGGDGASGAVPVNICGREWDGASDVVPLNVCEREADGASGAVPLEIRIVRGHQTLQPNLSTFGVPYDMVDCSEGGAIGQLLQRLQEEQVLQAEQ